METEIIDKLFLELSQFTKATTARETIFANALKRIARAQLTRELTLRDYQAIKEIANEALIAAAAQCPSKDEKELLSLGVVSTNAPSMESARAAAKLANEMYNEALKATCISRTPNS